MPHPPYRMTCKPACVPNLCGVSVENFSADTGRVAVAGGYYSRQNGGTEFVRVSELCQRIFITNVCS